MDLVTKLPQNIWKTFTLFINMANYLKRLISPWSKSMTAGESLYSSQNSSSPEVIEDIGSLDMRRRIQLPLGW
uniref:Interferon gamma induced GTPase n=1 Tax=Mus musculus TaxID=10090 RepID=E9Q9N8_MOUSE